MLIHSHLPYDHSTSHARVPAGGIHLIASIDSVSEAQVTASFFGSTKALHGEVATTTAETSTHNHSNQQYSITAVTTSAGAIAERYAYSAYGEPTICDASGSPLATQVSSLGNRYSYTGLEWDATVGLHHFRARWMSPKTGRFLTRDPIGFEGSPFDLYEFGNSLPLQSIDPSGLICQPPSSPRKPRTPDQCCNDAGKLPVNSGMHGRAFCCDGRMVACVWPQNIPGTNPKAKDLMKKCVQQHEDQHVRDAGPCPPGMPRLDFITYPPGMNDPTSECLAIRLMLRCLTGARRECARDATCDPSEITDYINRFVIPRGRQACRLAVIDLPWP